MPAATPPATPLGLHRELFWDVNPEQVDVEKHAAQIIGRTVERGTRGVAHGSPSLRG